jgi:hypothetical protein
LAMKLPNRIDNEVFSLTSSGDLRTLLNEKSLKNYMS